MTFVHLKYLPFSPHLKQYQTNGLPTDRSDFNTMLLSSVIKNMFRREGAGADLDGSRVWTGCRFP